MIVLKKLSGLTKKENKELRDLDKIWKDIDSGRCKSYDSEEFFREMKKW
jgi:hypothetical protein